MNTKYYIIKADHARMVGVTDFRQGNEEKGYVVNGGDLVTAPQDVRTEAREVTEQEALEFVSNL